MKRKADRRRDASNGDLPPEYDFRGGVRGKHAARYAAGTNVVVLDRDVVATFPNAAAVNEALRALVQIIRRRKGRSGRYRRSA